MLQHWIFLISATAAFAFILACWIWSICRKYRPDRFYGRERFGEGAL
jgi:hypothetical protein